MVFLTNLPEECLLEIIFQTSSETLPALASTCQTLHRCATPHLYRFVYFWRPGYRGYTFPLMASPAWPRPISRATRIFNLPKFVNTMKTCSELRSYVLAASFDWQAPSPWIMMHDKTLRDALKSLPSSVFFHVSPPSCIWIPPVLGQIMATLDNFDTAALDLNFSNYRGNFKDPLTSPLSRHWLYELFCTPQLRQLSMSGLRHWEWFEDIYLSRADAKPGLSNITALILPNTVPVGRDLEEILTWPKALRIFHMETWVCADSNSFESFDGKEPSVLSPSKIMQALRPQSTSLEELYISGTYDENGLDDSVIGSMRSFTNLKRLGLPQSFFAVPKEEDTSPVEAIQKIILRLWNTLPSTLEELQIEVGLEFNWFRKTEGKAQIGVSRPTLDAIDLCMLMRVASYNLRFPALKRIALWQLRPHAELPPVKLEIVLGNIEKDFEEMQKVFDGIFDHNVIITCAKCSVPPLFGRRERLKDVKPNEARWFSNAVRPLEEGADIT